MAGSTEIAATIPDRCNPITSVAEHPSPCRKSLTCVYIAAAACYMTPRYKDDHPGIEAEDQLQRWLQG